MKNKDLKKQIKDHIYSLTPDVIDKIDFKSIQIEENIEAQVEPQRRKFKWSYGLTGALAFAVMLFFVISAVITPGPGPVPGIETRALSFDTKEEIYTISSFSSVALLYQNKQAAEVITALSYFEPLSDDEQDGLLIDSHINVLNQYLNFLEPLLTNQETVSFEIKKSVVEGYDKQITLSSNLLSDKPVTYTLYYNETKKGNKTLMDGLMLFQSEEYEFSGSLEVKNDEEVFELKAYQKNDRSNYIKVKQKKENNKQKFEYSLYENDDEVFESEIKIELKDNSILIELEYESDYKEIEFEITKEKANNIIHVDYEITFGDIDEEGEIFITVVLDPVTGKNVYHYNILSDDEQREFERERIFDDDDDDEDDEQDDDEEQDDEDDDDDNEDDD